MREDRDRLLDILDAITRIERYTSRGRQTFERDELIQTWVVHHIQIIGEAVRALSPQLRADHPDILWSQIIGMRNVLVHDYFSIDASRVWTVASQDLPDLRRQIVEILRSLEDPA